MILEAQYKDDHVVQILRPEVLIQEKKYEEAEELMEEIIIKQPDNYFVFEKLLLFYLDRENFKKLEERGKECSARFNRSFLAKILYATGAIENGKILDKDLFKIEDRREAIQKALKLAQKDDLVLLTGKGAEQYICVAQGQKIPWDDRKVVRELLKELE